MALVHADAVEQHGQMEHYVPIPLVLRLVTNIAAVLVFACRVAVAFADDSESAFAGALRYTVKVETSIRLPLYADDTKGVFVGAGFLVDGNRGWFMTNLHVASRSPAKIRVIRQGADPAPARRIWLDPYLDLAILEVSDRKFIGGMLAASLGCENFPPVGHAVGAFGYPWDLPLTATRGIISGRSDLYENGALLTDAPINSGNSGGPLISFSTGKVVGINTAALQGEGIQNLNFAVAMKYACGVLRLLQQGRDPSPPSANLVFMSGPDDEPLTVARNYMGKEYIRLESGDLLQEVVGDPGPLTSEADLVHALRGRLNAAKLAVERGESDLFIAGAFPPAENLLKRRGVFTSGVMFIERRPFDEREVNFGAISTCYIEPGTAAQSAGIGKCDTVESIDGEAVQNLNQVYLGLSEALHEKRTALLELKRLVGPQGRSFFSYFGVSLPVDGLRWVDVTDE